MLGDFFDYRVTVNTEHLDQLGHVNNVEYVRWMQDAAVAHISSLGWSTETHMENGIIWVAHSHLIRYHQPAMDQDVLTLRTWVENFRKVRSLRKYQFIRESDEALLASAETDWALLSLENRRPLRIPQQLIDLFQ